MSCPDMPTPLCLVENTDTGLVLNESTVRVLSEITTPVVVVSIVGPYRTGKSYLLNRLMGRNNGFALGSTIQSKTKGIWAWCRPHPRNPKHTLVLLDTEGLGDVEKGDSNNDSHLFALATLMSSTLVYNNLGTLQNDAIDKLHFVSELTELIKVKSTTKEEDGEEFARFFPDFVWTVRDFTLELNQDGQKITPDLYLDMALKLKQGKGRKISDYNLPRECIRNFFKKLKCFVFDRPVQDAQMFKSMETLSDSQLDPGFLAVANEFCNYIFGNSMQKTYLGKSLNGSSIGSLLKMYLDTIRSGKIPCLESAFDSMAKIENQKAVDSAFDVYTEVRNFLAFPTQSRDELSVRHLDFEKRAVEHFLARAFDDKDGRFQEVLKNKISEEYLKLTTENEAASEKVCHDMLKSLSSELENRLSQGFYLRPGGYHDYTADKARIVNEYNTKPGRGVKAEHVLQSYLQTKEAEGQSILAGDQQMTAKEKEVAAQREAAELSTQREKAAQEEMKEMARKAEDDLKSHKEHLEQLQKKMEDERAQLKRETQILLEQQMAEQRKLLEEGFERRAKEKQDEIDSLKQQIEKKQDGQETGNAFVGFLTKAGETLLPIAGQFLQYKTMAHIMKPAAVAPAKPLK